MSAKPEINPPDTLTPDRKVVIFSKQISDSDHAHKQIARLTLDEKGRMVKLVVSR